MGLSGGHLRGGSNFAPLNQDPRCARSQKFRLFRAPLRRTRKTTAIPGTIKMSGEEKKGKILEVQGRERVQGRVSGNGTPFVPFCLQ